MNQDKSIEVAICLLAVAGNLILSVGTLEGRWLLASLIMATFFLICAFAYTWKEHKDRLESTRKHNQNIRQYLEDHNV